MAKKIWYSKTLQYFWEKYHRNYEKLKLDKKALYLKIKSDIHFSYPKAIKPEENTREILGTELWWDDYQHTTTHVFFMDKYLKNFLQATNLSDLEGIKQFLKENGSIQNVSAIKTREISRVTIYSYAIHVPYEKNGYSFSLGIDQAMKMTLSFCMGNIVSAIPEDKYKFLLQENDKLSQFNASTFRLAINTLAYMSCYPECVTDGVPNIIQDDYTEKQTITVNLSDKVLESNRTGSTVQPHFRKGYFRHLKSDFYKGKRNKIIFVHETMVNARAKTIHTANDLSKLEL